MTSPREQRWTSVLTNRSKIRRVWGRIVPTKCWETRNIGKSWRTLTKQFLITEVTHEYKLAGEYISPYYGMVNRGNFVYWAYRVPYEWVRRLDTPKEIPVEPVEVSRF